MELEEKNKPRIAIFSRYSLAEQYYLAAEFRSMLNILSSKASIYHLSFRGPNKISSIPKNIKVEELPLIINRGSARDIIFKFILMYLFLPIAIFKFRKFKPSVIFVSEILPFIAYIFKIFCRTNVATAYSDWHFHNQLGKKKWAKPILKITEVIDEFEAKRLDGFFSRSEAAGKRLEDWGIPKNRIKVVHDAPDLNDFYPRNKLDLRTKLGFKKDDIVLSYHGVMHSGKGLDKLITWIADLYKNNPKIGVIMVGTGIEFNNLKKLANDLGLGKRAIFTGYLKTVKEVGDYCNASDICVGMRAKSEANARVVPGAILHTMACKKITIAPDLEGAKEIIKQGKNGFLFKADDGEDFRKLINYLIKNKKNWKKIQNAAYEDVLKNYTVEGTAKKYVDAILHFASI